MEVEIARENNSHSISHNKWDNHTTASSTHRNRWWQSQKRIEYFSRQAGCRCVCVWRVVSQTLVTSMSTTLPNRCDSLTNLLSAFPSSWGNSHKHIEYTSQQVEIVLQTYRVLLPTTGNGLTNISSTPPNSWGWSCKPIKKLPNRLSKLTNLSNTPHYRWGYCHKPIEYTS